MSGQDHRHDAAVCKHVDAIAVLLGCRVVGIMALRDPNCVELICPEDGVAVANAWVVQRVVAALSAIGP